MGYDTSFDGCFKVTPVLKPEHRLYLKTFSETRRMCRDNDKLHDKSDNIRFNSGLGLGIDGEYYVGSTEDFGQSRDDSIVNYNEPPRRQPGLWCQWTPNEAGDIIEWDGGEKFYYYEEWIQYLITNFLQPWGYVLNGVVTWHGEDNSDNGKIVIKNNVIEILTGKIVYE